MGEDEEWILRTLNAYKQVMTSLIEQYRGRVVNAAGDNVLAEFEMRVKSPILTELF